jgi:hypothetical protein
MKQFKGAFLATLALLAIWVLTRSPDTTAPVRPNAGDDAPALFVFEKSELVRVEIDRADGPLVLAEQDQGRWLIEGPNWVAASSMVNRIKHQLHDLAARATVIEDPEQPERYGLGENAIRVVLSFRAGTKLTFEVGDPNPTAVSWYLRPLPGDRVFTVKKSAMDSFEKPISEFRERRFASFESKDADRLEAEVDGHPRLVFQRSSDENWDLLEPIEARASRSSVQRLLGRIVALKALDFGPDIVAEDGDDEAAAMELAKYGFDPPRARIRVKFASREPLDLQVGAVVLQDGAEANVDNKRERRAYMRIVGDPSVYIGRDQMLTDFTAPPETMRNLRFVRLKATDIERYTVSLKDFDGVSTQAPITVRRNSEGWSWPDGGLAAGSTTKRMASRATELKARAISARGPLPKHGLDDPMLVVAMTTDAGETRTLTVGAEGPTETLAARPVPGPPGAPALNEGPREERRFYATVDDDERVYLIGRQVLATAEDLEREYRRRTDDQTERGARIDKIESGK